jgi:hypothetical protein
LIFYEIKMSRFKFIDSLLQPRDREGRLNVTSPLSLPSKQK